MSTEEQMAGIGRLVTEAADAKQKTAILKSNLEKLSGRPKCCIYVRQWSDPEY